MVISDIVYEAVEDEAIHTLIVSSLVWDTDNCLLKHANARELRNDFEEYIANVWNSVDDEDVW
jgi:hypothetical protein